MNIARIIPAVALLAAASSSASASAADFGRSSSRVSGAVERHFHPGETPRSDRRWAIGGIAKALKNKRRGLHKKR